MTTCFHHRDRETGRSCTRCGRPACPDCLREAPVGANCWECVRAARPPARERVRRWNATAGPVVTQALIGLNAVVFVFTTLQAGTGGGVGSLRSRLVLFGPAVADGEWYRLVTSGFVHFGLIHIAFNMLLLYRFGLVLESELGRARFLGLYVGSLLAGSCGVMLLDPLVSTGGASGAVFGVVGAAALALRRHGTGIWQSGIGGLLALNLVLTFVIPGISVGGHLGGLAGGLLLGAGMLRPSPLRRATIEGLALAVMVSGLAVAVALSAAPTG